MKWSVIRGSAHCHRVRLNQQLSFSQPDDVSATSSLALSSVEGLLGLHGTEEQQSKRRLGELPRSLVAQPKHVMMGQMASGH